MNAISRSFLIVCLVFVSFVVSTPNSYAQTSECWNAPEFYMDVGATAWVVPGDPNNMRSGPGSNFDVIAQIRANQRFTVIGGPVCSGGYRWWEIRTQGGVEGWTADGAGSERWLDTEVAENSGSLPGTPESVPLGGLTLNNYTGVEICALHWTLSYQPSPDWSSNPLEDNPLPPDDYRETGMAIPPGVYDIWVGDCDGNALYTTQEVEVEAGKLTFIMADSSSESEPPVECSMEQNPNLHVNDLAVVSGQYTVFVETMKAVSLLGTPGVAAFASWDADQITTYAYGPDGTMQADGALDVGDTVIIMGWPVCVDGLLFWETSAGFVLDGIQGRWGSTAFQAYFLQKPQAEDDTEKVYITGVDPLQDSVFLQLYASGDFANDFRDGRWVAMGNGVFAGIVPNPDLGFVNIYVEAYCGGLNYSATFCSITLSSNSPDNPYQVNACDSSTACDGSPSGTY